MSTRVMNVAGAGHWELAVTAACSGAVVYPTASDVGVRYVASGS